MQHSHKLLPLGLILLLAACSSQPEPSPLADAGSPQPPQKSQVIEIPQATGAIPRPEPLSASGNQDYWIGKQQHKVWRDIKHYSEEGTASWLAKELDGNKTANGDRLDSTLFSAAHRNLPLPSYVRVTNLDNGLETIVRVNDRGPFNSSRLIDLSYAAAKQLDMVASGEARVRLELISDTPDQMMEMAPMAPMVPMVPVPPAATAEAQPSRESAFLGTPAATASDVPATASDVPAMAASSPADTPASPPLPVKTPAATAAAKPAQGKMMQVLASGSQPRAEALGKVMTQRYGVPYQVVAHGAIFRVLLGPVATGQQQTLLEQIRQGGLPQAFIVP